MKRISKMYAAAILFTLNAAFSFANSSPVITVTKDLDQKANRSVEFFLDEANTTSISEVLQKKSGWSIPDSENLTFALGTTTTWIKLRFQNSDHAKQTVFLEFNPVFLEKIHAYDHLGNVIDASGSTILNKRVEGFPTVQFELPTGSSIRYVSVKSRSNSLALRVRSASQQTLKSSTDIAVFCILVGGLLLLMTYHLFLFGTYRNKTYLFYSLFIASTILFTVSFCAYHKVLLPATMFGFHVDFWWSALSAPILLLAMYLFSASLLNLFPERPFWTKQNRKRIALLALPLTEIVCILGVFITDNATMLIPIRFSGLLHVIILPAVAITLWNRKRSDTMNLYYAFSWIPFALGGFLIVAWLSGAVAHHVLYSWSLPIGALFQSLLLSFAAGQQLNIVTRDKLEEQKAKLRLTKELEIEVEKLSKRDQVISSYVSTDIVQELDRGENPLTYQPRNVNKCIVFLDMHNYTSFFETHSALECQQIINQYFKLINDTTYQGGGKVDKIIGDAMMLEFTDPISALKVIVQLRRNLSNENKKRYDQNLKPLKFGLGVSYGNMLSANFGSSYKLDRTVVGDPVNVASRLETITRQFSVDVLCSKEFIDLQPSYQYSRPAGYVLLKGRQKKSLVYEIFEHQPKAVIEWKLSTKPKITEAIELELSGKYLEALAAIQSLIDICPEHTIKKGVSMDLSLNAMTAAITEKMRQLEIKVPTAEDIKKHKRAA